MGRVKHLCRDLLLVYWVTSLLIKTNMPIKHPLLPPPTLAPSNRLTANHVTSPPTVVSLPHAGCHRLPTTNNRLPTDSPTLLNHRLPPVHHTGSSRVHEDLGMVRNQLVMASNPHHMASQVDPASEGRMTKNHPIAAPRSTTSEPHPRVLGPMGGQAVPHPPVIACHMVKMHLMNWVDSVLEQITVIHAIHHDQEILMGTLTSSLDLDETSKSTTLSFHLLLKRYNALCNYYSSIRMSDANSSWCK